jgi:membrane-bound serine protease (ClpP class)
MKNNLIMAFILFLTVLVVLVPAAHAQNTDKNLILINLDEEIDPGSGAMFQSALSQLSNTSTAAVIIVMNTPGGYLSDMENIVDSINATEAKNIPVYTYIVPDGWGASAGSYVAMATDLIYMGNGSFIGPSTPEVVGGTSLEQNHTTAGMEGFMTSMAQAHGRNVTAAYSMVANNTYYTADQAVKIGLVEGICNNLSDFINLLGLKGLTQINVNPSPYDNFLSFLSDSYVDGILILIGVVAILLDLYHGSVVLSIVGLIAIGLGLVGIEIIGGQLLGLLFIVLGSIIMLLEIKTGHGIALISGLVLGIIGAFLLSPEYISSKSISGSVSPFNTTNIIISVVLIVIALFIVYYLTQIFKGFKFKKFTGGESLIDKVAVARGDFTENGWVSIEGQEWQAISVEKTPIRKGEKVVVAGRDGLKLIVKKIDQAGKKDE